MVEVERVSGAPGPVDDPVTVLQPFGWELFRSAHARAWVLRLTRDAFLLHWIESDEAGHGRAVMAAIGRWADDNGLTGRLTCMPGLSDFYTSCGWQYVKPFALGVEMERSPQTGAQP